MYIVLQSSRMRIGTSFIFLSFTCSLPFPYHSFHVSHYVKIIIRRDTCHDKLLWAEGECFSKSAARFCGLLSVLMLFPSLDVCLLMALYRLSSSLCIVMSANVTSFPQKPFCQELSVLSTMARHMFVKHFCACLITNNGHCNTWALFKQNDFWAVQVVMY